MSTTEAHTGQKPVSIAPAPTGVRDGEPPPSLMPYTCQVCARRKVKCDKLSPSCSSCRKGKLECVYQEPQPRRRRRRLSDDGDDKVARYERILREHGLLSPDGVPSPTIPGPHQDAFSSANSADPLSSRSGKLMADQGKSRYIDSSIWTDLGDDELQRISHDEESHQIDAHTAGRAVMDPLTGTLMGGKQDLTQYHPSHAEAMVLWNTHVESVEPICKILHIPSTYQMIDRLAQAPMMASPAYQCLMFAIYHFAVFSMTDEDCMIKFGQSRAVLNQRYHFATRQALVNASFLKTTEILVLQALVLFLLPCRYIYDSLTYWILTGVAVRIGQRMGLHRDGEALGLPPFQVQMRRRLFYQLIPLDGVAAQLSGTGISVISDSWDTKLALNIDDDQMWPGMTEMPEEKRGATEMIFCLARACVGKYLARTRGTSPDGQPKDYREIDLVIDEAEREVEDGFIRYCDVVNPLHFLTMCLARTAVCAMRIRARLPHVSSHTATQVDRKELFKFSQKIIDTALAAHAQPSLKRFKWHMRLFFTYGSWDSLVYHLTSLRSSVLLSRDEVDGAWDRLTQLYSSHEELLEMKQALHIAIGRLALKAWDINPPSNSEPPPPFIAILRSQQSSHARTGQMTEQILATNGNAFQLNSIPPSYPTPTNDANVFGNVSMDSMDLTIVDDFNLDTVDWAFWDQLIQNYQVQTDQEQGP